MVWDSKFFVKRCFILDDTAAYYNLEKEGRGIFYLDVFEKQEVEYHKYNTSLTSVHNLGTIKNEDELYLMFNKTIRNSINWCRSNGVEVNIYRNDITGHQFHLFLKTLKTLYRNKNLKISINSKLILNFLKSGSAVLTSTGNVFHLYKISNKRVILWFSCSRKYINNDDRNRIGKENRYLHFEDMLYFKSQNVSYYDWGGLSRSNPNDSIALFKKSFNGGMEVITYQYTIFKGFLPNLLRKARLV